LAAAEDEVLYGGAAGGGKTDALVIDALGAQQKAYAQPLYRALLLRRTFSELKEVMDRAQSLYPVIVPAARYAVADKQWIFPSGARIEFGYLQSDTDVLQYQSRQFQYLGWEELTQWPTDYPYRYMLSRLRAPERANLRCYVRGTTNPGGMGEKWVRERFRISEDGASTRFSERIEGVTFWRRFIHARLADNPHISPEYRQRLMLLPDADRQALLDGKWGVVNIVGAIFGNELKKATAENRITRVPVDPILPVQTVWDLGIGDATAIWFVQAHKDIRIVDYYEASGEGLPHYAEVLKRKGYHYGKHWAPHDIQVRELSSGRSRLEAAASLGIRFEVVPNVALEDGIHAARMLLPRCYFDAERCKAGLETLQNYRWDYNTRLGEFKPSPVHDWASHGADAFRYLALAINEQRDAVKIKPSVSRGPGGWMG
jgi:hypothetical protein